MHNHHHRSSSSSFSFLWIIAVLHWLFLIKPALSIQKLDCAEFDVSCPWLNANTASASNATLVWYRSSTVINADQLQMTTGTSQLPNKSYAIASTIVVDTANASQTAMLVSALVPCQIGNGSLQFNYWTSPFVLLNVCARTEGITLNRSSDCQRAPFSQGPGPATFQFSPIKNPFRFLIEASNFVYSNGQLTGGFAILDNVAYTGDYCTNSSSTGAVSVGNSTASNGTASVNGTSAANAIATNSTANSTATSSIGGSTNPMDITSSSGGNSARVTAAAVAATTMATASAASVSGSANSTNVNSTSSNRTS